MEEPIIEKHPHENGIEYMLVYGEKILGSVVPMDKPVPNQRRRWRAVVGQRNVGVFTSNDGRLCAMRAVRHFSRHLWVGKPIEN